jgi:hypothetical protein
MPLNALLLGSGLTASCELDLPFASPPLRTSSRATGLTVEEGYTGKRGRLKGEA